MEYTDHKMIHLSTSSNYQPDRPSLFEKSSYLHTHTHHYTLPTIALTYSTPSIAYFIRLAPSVYSSPFLHTQVDIAWTSCCKSGWVRSAKRNVHMYLASQETFRQGHYFASCSAKHAGQQGQQYLSPKQLQNPSLRALPWSHSNVYHPLHTKVEVTDAASW